jgi:hypothetical protein
MASGGVDGRLGSAPKPLNALLTRLLKVSAAKTTQEV